MPTTAEEIHAADEQRFAQVARSPEQARKFPVGPASARKLGYDPQEIDALPPPSCSFHRGPAPGIQPEWDGGSVELLSAFVTQERHLGRF
jgi:hypothetical protein